MGYDEESLRLHEEHGGKLEVVSKVPLKTRRDMSLAYTPGVAAPCREIARDASAAYRYTVKKNLVAVVTDGSAVLGLGNIGGLAGLPVMEGKCVLFKEFGGVDAVPICLSTQDPHDVIKAVEAIAPGFGGINLEDIKAPECFQVAEALQERLDIPVFHDDQDGTAIVILGALRNALKVVGKRLRDARVVVVGAGAAGIATIRLLLEAGAGEILLVDTRGIVPNDYAGTNEWKASLAGRINTGCRTGSLADALEGADVLIGVSTGGIVSEEMVSSMASDAIVLALANPDPEIMPDAAKRAGAAVVGTGRSDFENQINNVLVFPGIFRGLLDARARDVTVEMKLAAAEAVAACVPEPSPERIIPSVSKAVCEKVAVEVRRTAKKRKE